MEQREVAESGLAGNLTLIPALRVVCCTRAPLFVKTSFVRVLACLEAEEANPWFLSPHI